MVTIHENIGFHMLKKIENNIGAEIYNGCAIEFDKQYSRPHSIAIIDPPYDDPLLYNVGQDAKVKFVFTDSRYAHYAIGAHGAPTWIFVWDCVSSWYTPNRPLQRCKYCFFYGAINQYNADGYRNKGVIRKTGKKTTSNTRGKHEFIQQKHPALSDVYQRPITSFKKNHPHQKPIDWATMLVCNCSGSVKLMIDYYLGSGIFFDVSLIANKTYIGCEIEKKTIDDFILRVNREENDSEQLSLIGG